MGRAQQLSGNILEKESIVLPDSPQSGATESGAGPRKARLDDASEKRAENVDQTLVPFRTPRSA